MHYLHSLLFVLHRCSVFILTVMDIEMGLILIYNCYQMVYTLILCMAHWSFFDALMETYGNLSLFLNGPKVLGKSICKSVDIYCFCSARMCRFNLLFLLCTKPYRHADVVQRLFVESFQLWGFKIVFVTGSLPIFDKLK